MKVLFILFLLISIIVAYPAENFYRIKRGSTKSEHKEKTVKENGQCMKIAYDLKTTDANPNARPTCTIAKCGETTSERVACRTYFPDTE
ncbi:unnamed protein product [Caenorhabditis angaria]|uniref:Uncharacterized protein n=1 Tax=Caenorhabditis angaria TaxID=860376 RepID=A0A9P1J143_9PELO|nr:unnamed protein product [Caenorhabditis angaria]